MTRTLSDIQRWMQIVITHPQGVSAGIAAADAGNILPTPLRQIEDMILPSGEMSSLDRLQIYNRAYFGRLIECLQAQFPAVRRALGNEAFDAIAFGYLIQFPSTRYTLESLGDSFPDFLQTTRPPRTDPSDVNTLDFADFLIGLARLERTYSDVFNGQGPERAKSLVPADFDGLSAEDFSNCRLAPHACVRLLEFDFPVHEYATANRKGTEPSIPNARPVCLVVTRRDYIVRRFEITRRQFELLSLLIGRATIGESLQALCSQTDSDVASLATDLRKWFRDWSAAPLFAKLERP